MTRNLIIVVIWCFFFMPPYSMRAETLPQFVGPLRLEQLQSGDEARQEINRLHGKQLSFREGFIGTYGKEKRKVKVWVSVHDSDEEAEEIVGKMAERIKVQRGGVFWHYRETFVEERLVYFVLGVGQAHYFYNKGEKVIWLAADPSEARDIVGDFIAKIP